MQEKSISKLFEEYSELKDTEGNLKLQLSKIQDRLEEISKVMSNIDSNISQAPTATQQSDASQPKYRSEWSNIQKAIHFLRHLNKFLTIRDIVNLIKEIENRSLDSDFDKQLVGTLSSVLSTKAKKGSLFCRYQPYEGAEWLYGLKNWWDNDRQQPIEEYRLY
jgi:chromosome segregation ATPase